MDTYNYKKLPFSGVATALCTPFTDGEVDTDVFSRLVEWQIDMGVSALCVAGTTGESATLSRAERKRLLSVAKEHSGGKVPVIVGCGSACTDTACTYCRDAAYLGADALLVITPYCNKGTKSGVVEHFRRVAEAAAGVPVILYNVPSRTGVDLDFSQYKELSKIKNIVAVKEASSNFTKITRILEGEMLNVYSGNDDMTVPVISVGGSGVISVLSNIAPAEVSAMTVAALSGDYVTASKLARRYARLVELLFSETNPAPVKYAMSLLDLLNGEMRLPMSEVTEDTKKKIKAEMQRLSMI
ncbi:MAG: 4-hydroxy-tetrahydrodipicolinate synthase [Clostridia bacterium]|nr:4-hydroxy-tetrahydrodipicolinate synthase [Clostridia bacterium]